MKIHFIKTPDTREIYPPSGFSYVITEIMKAGFEVEFIDTNLIGYPYEMLRKNPRACLSIEPDWEKIEALFLKKDIQYAFLTGSFTRYIHNTARVARMLKKINPHCISITGGVHVSSLPEDTLKKFKDIDYVVIGEGECTSKELLFRLINKKSVEDLNSLAFRKDSGVVVNKRVPVEENIDKFSYPAKSLWPVEEYREIWKYLWNGRDPLGLVMTSRGCVGQCIFCASGRKDILENRLRFRSFSSVKEEIESLIKIFNITSIDFIDDCFTVDKNRLFDLCSYLKEKNIPWLCKSRVDTVSKETLNAMKEAGCRSVFLGIESADTDVLKTMGKYTTLEKIRDCVKTFEEVALDFAVSFTIGHPGETKKSIKKTVQFARWLARKGIGVGFYLITPYPGSLLYDMARREGWLYVNDWMLFDQLGRENAIYAPWGWTPEELILSYRRAWKSVDRAHIMGRLFNRRFLVSKFEKIKSTEDINIFFSSFKNIVRRTFKKNNH